MNKSCRHKRFGYGVCVSSAVFAATHSGLLLAAESANNSAPVGVEATNNANSLDAALRAFTDQTGLSLIYDPRIVEGRTVGFAGETPSSPTTALEALLSGTSLEYHQISETTLAIIEAPKKPETFSTPPVIKIPETPQSRFDEIIVTASYRAPAPVPGVKISFILDSDELLLSGAQSVAEPIQELPVSVASISSANTQLFGTAGGLNLTDLRGLGPTRSLVLLNGRRIARTSGGNGDIYGVDLGSLPTDFIERVELINQSAAASLGTEAVAGAVNFVLRDHIDGVSFSSRGGISERGDGEEYAASLIIGDRFFGERLNATIGGAIAQDASLFFTDRDYLSEPYGYALNGRRASPQSGVFTQGFGGSSTTPAGVVAGAVNSDGETLFLPTQPRLTAGGFEAFEGRPDQLYNWIEGFSALPETERIHAMMRLNYEASPNLSLYSDMLFSEVRTISQVAAAPAVLFRGNDRLIGDALRVPADHPDAPAGLRSAIEATLGETIDSFLINRRFAELGPRRRNFKRRLFNMSAGAEWTLTPDWTANAYYLFSRSNTRDIASGAPDAQRLALSVQPSECAATPGCVPFNAFNGAMVSQDIANYLRAEPRTRRIENTEHVAHLSLSGAPYSLNGQTAQLSVGAEFRRDIVNDKGLPDTLIVLTDFNAPGASGAVNYGDVYFHADLPLTSDASSFGAIRLGMSARLTRWTGGGATENLNGNLSWMPVNGLELYGAALFGGRAPNVNELFAGGFNTAFATADPCSELSIQTFIDNCAADTPLGVPDGFQQSIPLLPNSFSGNPSLNEERIRSRHFGVAAALDQMFDLNGQSLRLSADWRFHRIKDQIYGFEARPALFGCYDSVNLTSVFCGANPATGNLFIQRDPNTSDLALVETTFLNIGETRTSGLDASVTYQGDLDWAPLSSALSIDALYSYTHKIETRGPYSVNLESELLSPNFPRHQFYGSASLEAGRWKTLWTAHYRSATTSTKEYDFPETRLRAQTYIDAALQFRPNNQVILYAGVEDLFDKKVPVAAFTDRGFYAEFYNPLGRRYFAGLKAEF